MLSEKEVDFLIFVKYKTARTLEKIHALFASMGLCAYSFG